jgi:hypothetical protein
MAVLYPLPLGGEEQYQDFRGNLKGLLGNIFDPNKNSVPQALPGMPPPPQSLPDMMAEMMMAPTYKEFIGNSMLGLAGNGMMPMFEGLHGSSQLFDKFKPEGLLGKGHGVTYFSKPGRVAKTQAEHIAEGPFGGYLYKTDIDENKLKLFDILNDPKAKSIMEKHELPIKGWVEYPDMYKVAPDAIKEGYSLFRVWEPSVHDYSYAVSNPDAIKILERKRVK